jgi:hypothetical protein
VVPNALASAQMEEAAPVGAPGTAALLNEFSTPAPRLLHASGANSHAMRYTARWDVARGGFGVFDDGAGAWVPGYPVFGVEHVARGMAATLNETDLADAIHRCLQGLRLLAGHR